MLLLLLRVAAAAVPSRLPSQVLPWVKLVASMREPISRFLSMLGHNMDKDHYTCLKK